MRLPTLTIRQTQEEDARVIHERLWTNFCANEHARAYRCCADARAERLKMVGNLRRFWAARGYVLCSTADDTGYALWLMAKPQSVKAVA